MLQLTVHFMKAIAKRSAVLMSVILLFSCFSGCAAEKTALADLSFYVPEIDYLGTSAEAMFEELEKTGDWPTLRDQTGEYYLAWAIRETPVVVDGNEYIENIVSGGQGQEPVPWAINLERDLTTTDAVEVTKEVKAVYDLLVSELGEPEVLVDSEKTVKFALSEGLDPDTMQEIEAWWILETALDSNGYPDQSCCLVCALLVTPHHGVLTISVHFYLQSEANFSHLARYSNP